MAKKILLISLILIQIENGDNVKEVHNIKKHLQEALKSS